jgi:hypothetical protein
VRLHHTIVLAIACLALVGAAHAQDDGGATIVRQMHDKYHGAWFATARFAQTTTTYDAHGRPGVEMWYERIQLPGKLRIDIGPVQDANAMILVDGQLHSFSAGHKVDSRPLVSLALLLGFDAYMQSPAATVAQLRHEGINTAKVHEDSWQGRAVVVVGADAGDARSPQFWVDEERLLAVRIIQPSRKDPTVSSDIRFLDFQDQRRGVIAARIEVYQNDRLVMSEVYSDIETDIPLDQAWFDASMLTRPTSAN